MIGKTLIQEKLHKKCVSAYEDACRREEYLLSHGDMVGNYIPMQDHCVYKRDFSLIPMEICGANFNLKRQNSPFLLFASKGGCISEEAFAQIRRKMKISEHIMVCYAHEDHVDEKKSVCFDPWYKPVWSPDTFLSYNYFGHFFVVRRSAAMHVSWLGDEDYEKNLYDMLLQILFDGQIHFAGLIDSVLYHVYGSEDFAQESSAKAGCDRDASAKEGSAQEGAIKESKVTQLGMNRPLTGSTRSDKEIRLAALARIGQEGLDYTDEYGICHIYPKANPEKISILIPSKDHPLVLERCVGSLRSCTTHSDYEIIVVDNGSSKDNRGQYEKMAKKYNFAYYYEPGEFNFSRMSNFAAQKASGQYYLFLNDDMEICQPNWLEMLQGYASLNHAGAVGAKLLYPESHLLQHCGITNLTDGPVHKLQGEEDTISYYYGVNRVIRDAIGVTAACLMLRAEKFWEMEGFYEGLAVAYNDVDLNFRLHRSGYYNIQVNGVVLFHHESLSRGNDMLDEAKQSRLWRENAILYDRNPDYYDFDPFYGRFLVGVSNLYFKTSPFENRNLKPVTELKKSKIRIPTEKKNETLIIQTDHVEKNRRLYEDGKKSYLIDLHAHVRGLDSADYDYFLYLKGPECVYSLPCVRRLRPDVAKNLYNEKHVELSGFVLRIMEGTLPAGEYEIWVKAKCKFSRQVLYNVAREKLMVE